MPGALCRSEAGGGVGGEGWAGGMASFAWSLHQKPRLSDVFVGVVPVNWCLCRSEATKLQSTTYTPACWS